MFASRQSNPCQKDWLNLFAQISELYSKVFNENYLKISTPVVYSFRSFIQKIEHPFIDSYPIYLLSWQQTQLIQYFLHISSLCRIMNFRNSLFFPFDLVMKIRICHLQYFFKHWKSASENNYRGINLKKNYYKMLSIPSNASHNDIKKSYFMLAKKHHPDVNPQGHAQFTQIQQAYNVLSNQEFREYYNSNSEFGTTFSKNQKQKTYQQTDYRHQKFYEDMKKKGFEDFDEQAYQEYKDSQQRKEKKEQPTEEEQANKRIQDQINLVRKLLFTRNPIWQSANAYMSYQQRQERSSQKDKEMDSLFPKSRKVFHKIEDWISKF